MKKRKSGKTLLASWLPGDSQRSEELQCVAPLCSADMHTHSLTARPVWLCRYILETADLGPCVGRGARKRGASVDADALEWKQQYVVVLHTSCRAGWLF